MWYQPTKLADSYLNSLVMPKFHLHPWPKYPKSNLDRKVSLNYLILVKCLHMRQNCCSLALCVTFKSYFVRAMFVIIRDCGYHWKWDDNISPAMFDFCDGNRPNLMACKGTDEESYDLCYDVERVAIEIFKATEDAYFNIEYNKKSNSCQSRMYGTLL